MTCTKYWCNARDIPHWIENLKITEFTRVDVTQFCWAKPPKILVTKSNQSVDHWTILYVKWREFIWERKNPSVSRDMVFCLIIKINTHKHSRFFVIFVGANKSRWTMCSQKMSRNQNWRAPLPVICTRWQHLSPSSQTSLRMCGSNGWTMYYWRSKVKIFVQISICVCPLVILNDVKQRCK